ncbi:hypothetical protein [Streptomyces sp. NBC_00525]|uniref:hypothetical protein n=1 Tax=Streptomyces sp. NBC_00525 TaxID=2903660 RepID=UPI002E822537|nr:hypothetical protein [Streptomyces sp. NBC_00525]WUC93474.1 hypothetical protein OG710_07565 [Streptomyces sp. NBC_00525]
MSTPLLRLYPAGYRRAFGDDIAEAYREAVEGAGRSARLREAGDIMAHALRVRLRLGSAQRAGRLFAAAAPFALAATAAYAAFGLVSMLADWRLSGTSDFLLPLSYVMIGCDLVTLTGAVLALGGRFTTGARWAFAGALTQQLALVLVPLSAGAIVPPAAAPYILAPVAVAALPVTCPPDLRPPGRALGASALAALSLWTLLVVAALALTDVTGHLAITLWRLGVPMTAALLLAGRPALSRLRTPGRFALAGAPFVAMGYCAGVVDRDTLVPALAAMAAAGVALRLWRVRAGAGAG